MFSYLHSPHRPTNCSRLKVTVPPKMMQWVWAAEQSPLLGVITAALGALLHNGRGSEHSTGLCCAEQCWGSPPVPTFCILQTPLCPKSYFQDLSRGHRCCAAEQQKRGLGQKLLWCHSMCKSLGSRTAQGGSCGPQSTRLH